CTIWLINFILRCLHMEVVYIVVFFLNEELSQVLEVPVHQYVSPTEEERSSKPKSFSSLSSLLSLTLPSLPTSIMTLWPDQYGCYRTINSKLSNVMKHFMLLLEKHLFRAPIDAI